MKASLTSLSLMAAFLLPVAAFAADPPTLTVEGGVAVPLATPQTDRFDTGGTLALKPLIGVVPFFDVGAFGSFLSLPSQIQGINAGSMWSVGPVVRFKRPHDESNTGTGLTAVSPWIDGSVQYARTGPLDRVALTTALGASVPLNERRNVWFGPYVRYLDIAQVSRAGIDGSDAHVLIFGLSLEIGPSPLKAVREPALIEPILPPRELPAPVVRVVEPETFELNEKVQFGPDSAVILPAAVPHIAHVIDVLKAHKGWSLVVEGHASNDGPPEPHNLRLSEKRAQAVLDCLKAAGLPADRMTARGFSYSRPIADNGKKAGRVENRRVEFNVRFVIRKEGSK
jgi:outer membrane protein OmpA-like peptidoglycan-associated protein